MADRAARYPSSVAPSSNAQVIGDSWMLALALGATAIVGLAACTVS